MMQTLTLTLDDADALNHVLSHCLHAVQLLAARSPGAIEGRDDHEAAPAALQCQSPGHSHPPLGALLSGGGEHHHYHTPGRVTLPVSVSVPVSVPVHVSVTVTELPVVHVSSAIACVHLSVIVMYSVTQLDCIAAGVIILKMQRRY
jgi:hypothetical protein